MAQGSGSALVASLLLCILALSCTTIIHAKQYTVGDASGWELSVDYTKWAAKYKFAVGDTLLFTYGAEQHDVYQVSEADYNACDSTKPIKMWSDGSTVVTLAAATTYYFVCGIPGHCTGGMKVAVTATGGAAAPTAAPPAKAPASTPPAKAPVSTPPAKALPAKAPVSTPPAKAPVSKTPPSPSPSPASTTPTPSPALTPTPTPSPSSSPSPAVTPSSPSSSPASSPPSPPSPAAAPSNSSTPPSSSHALASPQFLLFSAILGSLLLPFC